MVKLLKGGGSQVQDHSVQFCFILSKNYKAFLAVHFTVNVKAVLEFAPLCDEQSIETAVLSTWCSVRKCRAGFGLCVMPALSPVIIT